MLHSMNPVTYHRAGGNLTAGIGGKPGMVSGMKLVLSISAGSVSALLFRAGWLLLVAVSALLHGFLVLLLRTLLRSLGSTIKDSQQRTSK